MQSTPNVSVIIPNYNYEAYLTQRIETVLNQTYQNFEVIILDDHSSDNSGDIIEAYRKNEKVTHIVYNQTNGGSPFIQWIKGVDLAIGKYIWIAESDDYSDLTFLEKSVASIENHPHTVLCYTDSNIVEDEKIIDENRPSIYYNKLFNTNRWTDDFLNDGNNEVINYMGGFCTIINASSCIFLRSAFPHQSKTLSKFKYCGDWFTWIEIMIKGKVSYLNEPLNYFRIHPKSTVNAYSKTKKTNELYKCLKRARKLTNGQSIIPNETLESFLWLWSHNSLYFFVKNFRPNVFMMHARLDKQFHRKIHTLTKNYFKIKFSRQ